MPTCSAVITCSPADGSAGHDVDDVYRTARGGSQRRGTRTPAQHAGDTCLVSEALSTSSALDSSPKSVTTQHEQPTTLRAVPSLSTLARPTHSPSCLPSETFMRSTECSARKVV